MSIFQSITSNDIRITPFIAHKQYQLDNNDIDILIGEYSNVRYDLSDTNNPIIQSLATSSGFYNFLIFDSINSTYYNKFDESWYNVLDIPNKYQSRNISSYIHSINIPQNQYGERLKESTIQLEFTNYTFVDDGYGNLIDTALSSSMDYYEVYNDVLGYWPVTNFFQDNYYGKDDSIYSNKLLYDNISKVTSNRNSYLTIPYYSESYAQIKHIPEYDFNSDYTLIFQCEPDNIPVGVRVPLLIKQGIVNGVESFQPYPFKFEYESDGSDFQIIYSIFDGVNNNEIISSPISLTATDMIMITLIKQGTQYQLIIAGVDIGGSVSTTDQVLTLNVNNIYNQSDIIIGKDIKNQTYFTGSIYNLRLIANSELSYSDIISAFYFNLAPCKFDYKVGNVFYNTGAIIFTSNASEYITELSTSPFTLSFKGSKTIHEWEISCTIKAGELNHTMNPSAKLYPHNIMNHEYNSFTTGSDWSPYMTSIGLYNDNLDLVAVAKLSKPIKIFNDIDMTFIIKFDI